MTRKRFYHSLRFRIIFGLTVIVALSMGGYYYLQTVLHRRNLVRSLDESSTHYLGNVIKVSLKNAMLKRDLDETRNIMTAVYGQEEVLNIFLVNKRGEIMVSPEKAAIGRRFALSEPTCEICHRSDSKDRPKTVLFTDKEGHDIVRKVNPILNEPECHGCHGSKRKVVGMLVTDFSLRGIDERLGREFRQRMVSLGFFLVVVTAVLSLGMERFVLARLHRFVEATKCFGRGDFGRDVPEDSRDEIGELAAAFNLMASDLREYMAERDEAEEALKESEEKFRSMSMSAQDGIILMDNEGKVSFWNEAAEKMFGYTPQEAIGKEAHVLLAPKKYHQAHKKGLSRFKESGEGPAVGKTLELSALRKDGTEFPIELSVSAFKIKGRWNAIGIVRDITKRKLAERELIRQEKLAGMGRLIAGVSHEIMNPLNGIKLSLYVMLQNPLSPELAEELREMEGQVRRVTKIAQSLLYFGRHRSPERREIDLNETVERTLELLEHDFRLGNIHVEARLAEELPEVLADQDQLHQVLFNLLNNACDAMPDGGRLTLSTYEGSLPNGTRAVELRVEDTGPGIPEEHMDKIFDPFFTTKPEGKGTGLGLSICRGILEAHEGTIRVENLPGGGTAFVISLPLDHGDESFSGSKEDKPPFQEILRL